MTVILDQKTATDVISLIRDGKKKIVFTHGVFDLLHVGHIRFLNESRKKGDYLVVGVDADWMAAKYKGIERPVIPLEQRMELIRELKSVDFVLPMSDDEKMGQDYFLKLYDEMHPNTVTFGNVFGFKRQYNLKKFKIKGVRYKEVRHKYENVKSTSEIIDQIKML